jgi:hypothetical protein
MKKKIKKKVKKIKKTDLKKVKGGKNVVFQTNFVR